ncbi:MAG TPA: SiaC family regulatory phosphoprotein [Bacteroidia bacterium]|jgi:hypothetical protein|nr:SiaC family regulatory phosphoprotein [Bacteroidia bacterium]
MEKLIIKETLNNPRVILDPFKKRYEISGKSFPENTKAFYQPVMDWLKDLPTPSQEKIRLSIILDYISSSSVISIKQLLTKIKEQNEHGADIEVLWHYDPTDADIKEIGEAFEKVIGIKLQFVSKLV